MKCIEMFRWEVRMLKCKVYHTCLVSPEAHFWRTRRAVCSVLYVLTCLPFELYRHSAYKSYIVVLGHCNLIKLWGILEAWLPPAFLKSLRKQGCLHKTWLGGGSVLQSITLLARLRARACNPADLWILESWGQARSEEVSTCRSVCINGCFWWNEVAALVLTASTLCIIWAAGSLTSIRYSSCPLTSAYQPEHCKLGFFFFSFLISLVFLSYQMAKECCV